MNKIDTGKLFEQYDIKPSFHRFKILEYLINNKIHPTVDKIYRDLVKNIPTLSKTTVYNTLKYFVLKGLVSELMVEGNEVRYEFKETPHLHFKCKKCGNVYDVYRNCEILTHKKIDGHTVEEYHIYLLGTCKNCLSIDSKIKSR